VASAAAPVSPARRRRKATRRRGTACLPGQDARYSDT